MTPTENPKLINSKPKPFLWRYWGWGLLAAVAIYMIVIPGWHLISQLLSPAEVKSGEIAELSFSESILLRATETFTAFWFFMFGATIGSFLNVVIYRVPRKESVIFKRSACPKCGAQIHGKDNIPVLGWIWLEGKCRACQLPISRRYPIVEAVIGLLFLLFLFCELLSGGLNLPVRMPNHYAGVVWIIFYTKWDLVGFYLFHCFVMISLFTWSMIRYDRNLVPLRSIATIFTIVFIALMLNPGLHLVQWNYQETVLWAPKVQGSLITAAIGAATGLGLSSLISAILSFKRSSFEREYIASIALAGAALGWQAASSVLMLSLLIQLIAIGLQKIVARQFHLPMTGCAAIATVLQLLTWRLQQEFIANWWPVTSVSWTLGVTFVVASSLIAAVLRGLISAVPSPTPAPEAETQPAISNDA